MLTRAACSSLLSRLLTHERQAHRTVPVLMRYNVTSYSTRRNLLGNGLRGTLPEALGDLVDLYDLCVRRV